MSGTGPQNRGGALRLAMAMARIAAAANEHDEARALPLATVADPRPGSLTVRFPGSEAPVPATASDLFDVFPLENDDLVLMVPVVGGGWHVIDRVTGNVPPAITGIALEDIEAGLVQTGPGVQVEGQQTDSRIQWYRGPSTSFTDAATDVTWTFEDRYLAPPFVLTNIESTVAGASAVRVIVKSVTKVEAVLTVFNASSPTGVSARVLAMAHGPV